MWESVNGKRQMCEILLNKGAMVNNQNHEGCAALHPAALVGQIEVCSLLLDKKADVNHQSHNGSFAL